MSLTDPREALSRMGVGPSHEQAPETDDIWVSPKKPSSKKKKTKKSAAPEESDELLGSSKILQQNQTQDERADETMTEPLQEEERVDDAPQPQPIGEMPSVKNARKAERKARKAAKKAAKEQSEEPKEVRPETQPDQDDTEMEDNDNDLAALLQQHEQEQISVDNDATLAARVLADPALRGQASVKEDAAQKIVPGARVAPMMGFPDQSNIDPMLRGPAESLEDAQRRIAQLPQWLAQQQQQQQQLTAPEFTQGAREGTQDNYNNPYPTMPSGSMAELAAAAEQVTEIQMEQPEAAPKMKKPRAPRKKKSDAEADESAEKSKKRKRASSEDGEEDAETVPAPKKRGRKSKASETAEEDGDVSDSALPAAGPFVKAEIARIERIVKLFRENNDMTQHALNELVQNKSREKSDKRDVFWAELYEALPHRQHVAIQRTARRRYHNYEARGVWTPDDDETLKRAYTEHPQKWVAIGNILGRMPEDCRDRWRNYLACGDTKRTEDWTQKEELDLTMIVQECASELRKSAKAAAKAKGTAFRNQDWEKEVNFNVVSQRMKHTRSRLQCYQHWRIMQNREAREHDGTGRSRKEKESAANAPKNEWRKRQALESYAKMTLQDKIKIVSAVAKSETVEEEAIPWRLLKKQDQGSPWSTMDRKVAYQTMKRLVPRQPTLVATCEAVLEYLNTWATSGVEPEAVDPAEWAGEDEEEEATATMVDETEVATPAKAKRGRKPNKEKDPASGSRGTDGKWKKKSKLSEETIVDSDDDDVDGQATEANMFDGEGQSVYRSAVDGQRHDEEDDEEEQDDEDEDRDEVDSILGDTGDMATRGQGLAAAAVAMM